VSSTPPAHKGPHTSIQVLSATCDPSCDPLYELGCGALADAAWLTGSEMRATDRIDAISQATGFKAVAGAP
jgi:hypothetical protein